mgnify:CR=1 FL=1
MVKVPFSALPRTRTLALPNGTRHVYVEIGCSDRDTLDTDRLEAGYDAGVLTVRIPVAEQAKPRRVPISVANDGPRQIKS